MMVGQSIGAYTVLAKLGEGGMGAVYRARDTKLDRDVAIKVLPESFANDPDRLMRFEREAKTLASLNHPNIAGIYGVEDGPAEAGHHVRALVMELVEGEDLSARIARLRAPGASARQAGMPLDEALPIARQIAEALEAAHEQGIIHRDLKPANIKVRPDGTVKVLDFGLAKAIDQGSGIGDRGSGQVANSPTITSPAMTQAGVILGTAAYMAPEQAKGRAVDRRADIWAFGAVLFEMLTGRRAFDGEDITDTIVAVMSREPQWDLLPASTPTALRQLLGRCLRKDARTRLRDIGEARVQLEELILGGPTGAVDTAGAPPLAPGRSARLRMLLWASWATVAALAVMLAMVVASRPRADDGALPSLVRLDVDLGPNTDLPPLTAAGSSVIISRDGLRLAYTSGNPPRLFTRQLDEENTVELAGTEGAVAPFFSPDGQWLGFVARNKVWKVSVQRGSAMALADIRAYAGGAWTDDGYLLFSEAGGRGLLRISSDGGEPEVIAPLPDGESALGSPQPLPGGEAVLFYPDAGGTGISGHPIEVLTLADRSRKVVLREGTSPKFLPSAGAMGHLLYTVGSTLFAVPFDVKALETTGTPVPVLENVAIQGTTGVAHYDVSRTGILVHRTARAAPERRVQVLSPTGRGEPLRIKAGRYRALAASPDGARLALTQSDGASVDLWVYDMARDTMTRLTTSQNVRDVTWSPDGRRLFFVLFSQGIFQMPADGVTAPQPLLLDSIRVGDPSLTKDGTRLLYTYSTAGTRQIWSAPVVQDGAMMKLDQGARVFTGPGELQQPTLSPDGRWLAYESADGEATEIYVRRLLPGAGITQRWQVSNGGGTLPRWSVDGTRLVYQAGDRLLSVRNTARGDDFTPESPQVIVARLGLLEPRRLWDVTPNGGIVMFTSADASVGPGAERHVVFLEHLGNHLARLAPPPQ